MDFHSISLSTLSYRVVVQAEWLTLVVDSIIIIPFQSAFIEGRQIVDLILIANEAVEDYKAKKKNGSILKLDLEKAFWPSDWSSLEKVLLHKSVPNG